MKLNSLSGLAVAVAVLVLGSVAGAAPEPVASAGKAIVKRHADVIVGVELVATVRMKQGDREAPPREQRVEVNGTVISPSGLTVTSLSAVDPQTMFEAMRAGGNTRIELVSVDFKEVKLRLANGEEVPARFVLKDADLDLAFMAPEADAGGRQFAHVALEQAADGAVLGTYFSLGRAPKSLQRVPLVRVSEVTGVVEKPRRFFLMTDQSTGTPTFDPEGRILGVTVQNFANGRPTGMVVLPAADIADMAKQAAAVQAKPAAAN